MRDTAPGKLKEKATQAGYESVREMVAAALDVSPSIGGAAAHIGVAPNAVANFLNREGLAVVREVKARLVRSDSGLPEGE